MPPPMIAMGSPRAMHSRIVAGCSQPKGGISASRSSDPALPADYRLRVLSRLLGADAVVAGDHLCAVGGGEVGERRLDLGEPGVAVNMRQQRLDARHQRLAVEQL